MTLSPFFPPPPLSLSSLPSSLSLPLSPSPGHPQILYSSDASVYRSLPMIPNTSYNAQGYSATTPNSVSRYQQPLSHLSGGPGSFQYVASPQGSYQASHPRAALYGQYTPVQVIQQVPATYLSSPRGVAPGVGTTMDQGTGFPTPSESYTSSQRHWNPSTYP